MVLIAVLYIGQGLLVLTAMHFGPGPLGVHVAVQRTDAVVLSVHPVSPAARAGLQPQDVITHVAGHRVQSQHDWDVIQLNLERDRPIAIDALRDGLPFRTGVTLSGLGGRPWWLVYDPALSVLFAGMLVLFILGLIIALRRPTDPHARLAALLAVQSSLGMTAGQPGIAPLWRDLPTVLGALLVLPVSSILTVSGVFFTFAATFPRRLWADVRYLRLAWIPVLFLLPFYCWYLVILPVYAPARALGAASWVHDATLACLGYYLLAGAVVFLFNYRRLTDPNDRRRVRVLVAGMAVGALSIVPNFLFSISRGPWPYLAPYYWRSPLPLLLPFGALLLPISLTFAVLRHRVLDVRLILRQGIQYALARGFLRSVVPLLGGLLLLDLLTHSDETLQAILRTRGPAYGLVLALLAAAYHWQTRWTEALDRRFFRERYDARKLLRAVAEEVRQARRFDLVAGTVVRHIDEALHPEFTAILLREPQSAAFEPLAVSPPSAPLAPLPADSKTAGLLRVLDKPLELQIQTGGFLQAQLPPAEWSQLQSSRIEWLYPVATQPDRPEAVLALGYKRSEEPYTHEDQDLLLAITASLALLLERPITPVPASPSGGLLNARYRLDELLGTGGMGTVYRATDTLLGRVVAIKVLRDDIAAREDLAQRFLREAKAAASFTHPNVVTVYDFGVAAGNKAFLVMELLQGSTLRDALQHAGRLPATQTLAILRDVGRALDAAHGRHLIHRDIKPDNIFLTPETGGERAKLLDFGIAKFVGPTLETRTLTDTTAGLIVGTPRYLAPEALHGGAPQVSWDLWSITITAYEMLTGASPFPTTAHFYSELRHPRLAPIQQYLPDAPPDLNSFFERSLHPDPTQRPQSITELLNTFETALTSRPVS